MNYWNYLWFWKETVCHFVHLAAKKKYQPQFASLIVKVYRRLEFLANGYIQRLGECSLEIRQCYWLQKVLSGKPGNVNSFFKVGKILNCLVQGRRIS